MSPLIVPKEEIDFMEKRVKVIIGKDSVKFETISGFSGTECHNTADAVMAGVGTCTAQGDTDERYRADDPIAFSLS